MLFNSYTFILFFALVLLVYYGLPYWKLRKCFLLIASYIFYAAWNPPFVILLWISTVADWYLARQINRHDKKNMRRFFLISSLCVNLGLLGFFKYSAFLLDNFLSLMSLIGIRLDLAPPSIILPVGISFYTFQTMSYTLDVYFRKNRPWGSFLDYALYVTFFAQLVAGPIVRAADFLPQCLQPKAFSGKQFGWGLNLLALGLFQKMVLADILLAPFAQTLFNTSSHPDFWSAWCGTLAFSGQIYCDFAGYSTCAIGIGMCLGFALPDNFRYPYAAIGFSDFWRRWHITLSSWLKDYLYIPLGGNRKGSVRTVTNLMITMLLGGLWHGASWTFLVWGGLHGCFLVIEKTIKKTVGLRTPPHAGMKVVAMLLTFLLVSMAWVFFRSSDFDQALEILRAMLGFSYSNQTILYKPYAIIKTCLVVLLIFSFHVWMRNRRLEDIVEKTPWPIRCVWISLMIYAIATYSGTENAFIYFQF